MASVDLYASFYFQGGLSSIDTILSQSSFFQVENLNYCNKPSIVMRNETRSRLVPSNKNDLQIKS